MRLSPSSPSPSLDSSHATLFAVEPGFPPGASADLAASPPVPLTPAPADAAGSAGEPGFAGQTGPLTPARFARGLDEDAARPSFAPPFSEGRTAHSPTGDQSLNPSARREGTAGGALLLADGTAPATVSLASAPLAPASGNQPGLVSLSTFAPAAEAITPAYGELAWVRRAEVSPGGGDPSRVPPDPQGPGGVFTQAEINQLRDGLSQALAPIDDAVGAQVFAQNLPLLGDGLKDLFDSSGATGAVHDVRLVRDAITAGFNALAGAATYTTAQVRDAMDVALRAAGFNVFSISPTVSPGGEVQMNFTTTRVFDVLTTPLASDLGLPGLGFQSSGAAQTTLQGTFNFSAGLDSSGFYLDTTPATSGVGFGVTTRIPGFEATARLGPLRFMASDLASSPTAVGGNFNVQFKDPNGDNKLRLDELAGAPDLLDATFAGNASINLHLASDLGAAVLPDIAADLNFNWNFSSAPVNPGAGPANFGSQPDVVFRNVSLGLGSFFNDFVNPVFGQLQVITGPLQPIVDVLTEEIKPLSDLFGSKVTVLTIAGGLNSLNGESLDRLQLYVDLIDYINSVPSVGEETRIDLGDYRLGGNDVRSPLFVLAEAATTPIRNALAAGDQSPELKAFLDGADDLPGKGLAFPIIQNPTTAINLLVGRPVDFFTYEVPDLNIPEQGFNEFYRILGPLGVRLQGTVEAHANLDVGYDSTGVAQFADTGDGEDILNGFYVLDQPGPDATLIGNLKAFAAFNVILAEAGVGGGLEADLNFYLNDNDFHPGDGRVHLTELNGECLFTTSGELGAGLSAYLTIGIGPFSETFEKNFAHVTILDFDGLGCDGNGNDGAPALARTLSNSSALNVGPDSNLRQIGDLTDGADDLTVFHVSGGPDDETVGIIAGGLLTPEGEPLPPQSYVNGANGRITGNGGDLDDSLKLAPDVATRASLRGGDGNDQIVGGANADTLNGDAGQDLLVGGGGDDQINGGNDPDFLDGQADADTLRGGGSGDVLVGGPGADLLDGGPGFDTASYVSGAGGVFINLANLGASTGDAQGDSYLGIERIVGSPFADTLLGDEVGNSFGGGEGADVINAAGGDDFITGDPGADALTGGSGNDFVAYTVSASAVSVSLFTGLGTAGDAAGDTLSGVEHLQGSSDFGDTLEGDDGVNWLRGLAGNNVLSGLGGADSLEGGKDNDSLDGGAGADILRASEDPANIDPAANPLPLTGGLDTLRGGAGNDILYGDDGGDLLDGGDDADQIFGAKDDDTILGGAGDDLITGGAGNDAIDAGEGANSAAGEDGDDLLNAGSGPDQLTGGVGKDTLNGGAGANLLNGDVGNDVLTALGGDDTLNGGADDDQLNADDGANVLNGDAGMDLLISGADADSVRGGVGNDTARAGAGDDLVFGEEDNDSLDGGIGADRVDGGAGNDVLDVGALRSATQDPNRLDHLFGGEGSDSISADFSNQTVPMVILAGADNSLQFADGAEARNFENLRDFASGSGVDFIDLNASNGAFDDGFSNLLRTGAGNDFVASGMGNDTVEAGDGDDYVQGGANLTVLTGDGFGTILSGTPGDSLSGGAGNDTVSFDGIFQNVAYQGAGGGIFRLGVFVDLATNQTGIAAAGTVISGFENVVGTNFADDLRGDAGPNLFMPLRGGGLFSGATGGPDYIDGAGGEDTLRIDFSLADLPESQGVYTNATSIYRLNVGNTATVDSYSYQNIEHLDLTGASKADLLYANTRNFGDTLAGLGGNDTLGGYGGGDTLLGGDGDDFLTGQGQFALNYNGVAGGRDFFDGGAGNDLVEDIAFDGIPTLDAATAYFQLDGGSGSDTLSADFSNQTAPIVWNSASPTDVLFADGAYFRNFEQMRFFAGGSGNDSLTQLGRVGNQLYLGGGDDTVNPGLGVDTVNGGVAGNDLAILDFSVGDTPDMAGVQGGGDVGGGTYFRPLASDFFNRPDNVLLRDFEHLRFTGTSKADNVAGTYGDDTLLGGDGDDTLSSSFGGNDLIDGGSGNDSLIGSYGLNGSGADDTLVGGLGNDTLRGEKGNDSLLGGEGNDQLLGVGNGGPFPTGRDVFDGGGGDDFVVDIYTGNIFNSYTDSTTRLLLDGGAGVDTLSADFGNQTQAIRFIGDGRANSVDFADGAYLRNFEVLIDFVSGTGNDLLVQPGRLNNLINGNAGNDTINPGVGIDTVEAGPGDDLLILDYSQGDTANVGGVVVNNPYYQRLDPNTGAAVDSISTSGFEHLQITGGSKGDNLVGFFASNDTLVGNAGNDTLNGGTGADRMDGGAGDDLFTVDDPGDSVIEGIGNGTDTVLTNINYTLGPNVENLTLGNGAFNGTGSNADNALNGNAGSNSISGLRGNDTLLGDNSPNRGFNQQDTLTGGQGADLFVLGATAGRLYDDNNAASFEYALIPDFAPDGQGDRLQLNGSASQYFLGASPANSGVPGTALFFDSNGNGALDPNVDEYLAILRSPGTLTVANTINNALFVTGG